MRLKLTYLETVKLDNEGCVYALREDVVYLVEKTDRLRVTVINAPVEIIKTYQMSVDGDS